MRDFAEKPVGLPKSGLVDQGLTVRWSRSRIVSEGPLAPRNRPYSPQATINARRRLETRDDIEATGRLLRCTGYTRSSGSEAADS